jgi:hypothetical protein
VCTGRHILCLRCHQRSLRKTLSDISCKEASNLQSLHHIWLWDLSSLTRCWTQALGSKRGESSPLDHQGIPWMSILSEIRTVLCLVAESCPTLFSPMACSSPGSSDHGDSPGKSTGVGCQDSHKTLNTNLVMSHLLYKSKMSSYSTYNHSLNQ